MGWWRKATDGDIGRARADRRTPDLLDVWSDPVHDIHPPDQQAPFPADYRRPPAPRSSATLSPATATDDLGGLTCIRLDCPEEGRPTVAARCPACGHGTALLRDFRWPRTG